MIYCRIIGGCFHPTNRITTATASTSRHIQMHLHSWVRSGSCALLFDKTTAKTNPSNFRKRMLSSSPRNNNNRETKVTGKTTTTTIETSTLDGKWILPTTIHHAYKREFDHSKKSHNNNNPILLISGWVGTAMDWGAFPKLLSSKTSRDVIVYDPRGMGHARPSSSSFLSPSIDNSNSIRNNDVNYNNNFNGKRNDDDHASSLSPLPLISSSPSSAEDEEEGPGPLHDMTLSQMAQDAVAVLNHVSLYYNNDEHGITKKNHQPQEQVDDDIYDSVNASAASTTNTSMQKEYEIGGVSMGGIIAQMVASSSRGCHDDTARDVLLEGNTNNNHHQSISFPKSWKISSLVLMSTTALTSPHVPDNPNEKDTSLSSSLPTSTQPQKKNPQASSSSLSCCPEFLKSFDGWLDHHDCHDTLYQTNRQCAKLFFTSLGDDFLRRPGRQKLQDKLIDSFLHSRMKMFSTTNASIGISAQRRALELQQQMGVTASSCFQSSVAITKNDTNDNNMNNNDGGSSIPSLIVHGEKDRVMPITNAYHLEQIGRPNSQLSILADGDHLLWITHGRELVDIVGDFYNHST